MEIPGWLIVVAVIGIIYMLSQRKKQTEGGGGRSGWGTGAGSQGKPRHLHPALIRDKWETTEEVSDALRAAGLESCNLIVGIDFTKSNEWTGKRSFEGHCLHFIDPNALPNQKGGRNPYQRVLSVLARTLSHMDDDGLIPAFGFGCSRTGAHKVFSFLPQGRPCVGLEGVLDCYKSIIPHVTLAGPTSFAPIVKQATQIVAETKQFHVLLLIADGQISRPSSTASSARSVYEQETVDAIVEASNYPLAIVMVGVGDGPWDTMEEFDDGLPARTFDNFQFVQYSPTSSDADFALNALMEVPEQYSHALGLGRVKHPFQTPEAPLDPPPGATLTSPPSPEDPQPPSSHSRK